MNRQVHHIHGGKVRDGPGGRLVNVGTATPRINRVASAAATTPAQKGSYIHNSSGSVLGNVPPERRLGVG